MKSAFRHCIMGLFGVATAMVAGAALAQSLPSSNGDPFAGVPPVDSGQMSAQQGAIPEATGTHTTVESADGECVAAACAGPLGSATGGPNTSVSASRNVVSVTVTAIVSQSSSINNSVLNTSGGSNSAGTN